MVASLLASVGPPAAQVASLRHASFGCRYCPFLASAYSGSQDFSRR